MGSGPRNCNPGLNIIWALFFMLSRVVLELPVPWLFTLANSSNVLVDCKNFP